MTDEPGESDQPIPGGFRSWEEYWAEQRAPGRAAPEVSEERQAVLRAAYAANLASGAPPYAGVRFQSRGELEWALAERQWDTRHDAFAVKYVLLPQGVASERADLRGAVLGLLDLSGIHLRRADLRQANLAQANLSGADLVDADLTEADLGFTDLTRANLHSATLVGTHLREATLAGVILRYADMRGARLFKADLTGARLVGVRFDAATVLAQARLDGHTLVRDVNWGGAPLSHVAWERLPILGDETALRHPAADKQPKDRAQRLAAYQGVQRAYQQLSVALRAQGLDDPAARYAYRAQVLQRKALWQAGAMGRWLFSWLLSALAGYGYRLQRILGAYVLTLTAFALAYFVIGLPNEHATTLLQHIADAYQVSLTAIHGRTFFAQFGVGSSLEWVAATESVCGLVIEAVFTSMLVQRFFAR
ncbi:MAG TPA: pentapeptide repeat-containing protein [Ktedonobacterales bacterium]|nr:pentapeptide repeat-containing protein [Ktedonobacterales bacterium]